jgi:hypothetical protein
VPAYRVVYRTPEDIRPRRHALIPRTQSTQRSSPLGDEPPEAMFVMIATSDIRTLSVLTTGQGALRQCLNSTNRHTNGADMYRSSGNYEAFARPRKPEGVDDKTAWLVGAGLASMSAAVFLIRDGQMPGRNITILERLKLPGGALDGIKQPNKGFVIRGGREMPVGLVPLGAVDRGRGRKRARRVLLAQQG